MFGTRHLDHLNAEYLAHYHEERPHQSLDNEPITAPRHRGPSKAKRGTLEHKIVAAQ